MLIQIYGVLMVLMGGVGFGIVLEQRQASRRPKPLPQIKFSETVYEMLEVASRDADVREAMEKAGPSGLSLPLVFEVRLEDDPHPLSWAGVVLSKETEHHPGQG